MIYLDSAASSQPLHSTTGGQFGNASSRTHVVGLGLKKAITEARCNIAEALQIKESCIVFTSGATESIEIVGKAMPFTEVTQTAHKAMLNVFRRGEIHRSAFEHFGFERVNNETGALVSPRPGSIRRIYSADVTQALFKVSPEVISMGDYAFAFGSAHKFHGPLGVGLLMVRDVDLWDSLVLPGNEGAQERGVRPGTLNAPAIIQTGEVAKWMLKNGDEYRAKLKHLQSTFENKIKSLTDCWVIGSDQERAPHITSLNLPGVDNEALIASVNDRLAIASGSACTSEKVEPSHVLMAMFNDREIADTTVRISYGWFNTETEVLEAAEIIAKAAETIRSFSL